MRAMPGCLRFSSAIASAPQAPGMNMSVTMRAGAWRVTAPMAQLQFSAFCTW